ncbi:MAG: hypothetical protein IPL28_21960 [Chloroflexi bacterium]|nr:hypothetical protein [Chloroflexota bacterium]
MNISWRNKLNGEGLYLISKIAQKTGTLSYTGWENFEAVREAGHPLLWGTWHGQSMLLMPFFLKKLTPYRTIIMMPDDWRGESLYYWTKKNNFHPQPMNLEDKGMDTARKFAELVKLVKEKGYHNYISPDGPHGPSHVVKPGLIYLAEKTGAPIVPIGAYARNVYEVKRWDAYAMPLPFAHIEVAIGQPIYVPRKANRQEMSEKVASAIHHILAQAKANFYLKYETGQW